MGVSRVIHIPCSMNPRHYGGNSFSPSSSPPPHTDDNDCLRVYAKELKNVDAEMSPINLDVTAVVALCSDLCNTRHLRKENKVDGVNHEKNTLVKGGDRCGERGGGGEKEDENNYAKENKSDTNTILDLLLLQQQQQQQHQQRQSSTSGKRMSTTLNTIATATTAAAAAAAIPQHIRSLANNEERFKAADIIMEAIKGKKGRVFICESAINCIERIFAAVGGSKERKRLKALLENDAIGIEIVKNKISERISRIQSKKLKKETREVFSTGDSIGAVTITSNAAAVRSARHAGVHLKVLLHPARALVGHIIAKAAADYPLAASVTSNSSHAASA